MRVPQDTSFWQCNLLKLSSVQSVVLPYASQLVKIMKFSGGGPEAAPEIECLNFISPGQIAMLSY